MKNMARTVVENAIIVVGILSFWPWVFGYRGRLYQIGLVVVLVMLGCLGVVRFLRVKRAFDNPEELLTGDDRAPQHHPEK